MVKISKMVDLSGATREEPRKIKMIVLKNTVKPKSD